MEFRYTKKLLEIGVVALVIGFISSVLTNGETMHSLNLCAVGDIGCQAKYLLGIATVVIITGLLIDFLLSVFKNKGKEAKGRISLIPKVEKRYIGLTMKQVKTALLYVHNSVVSISNCYATLEKVEYFKEPFFSPMPIYENVRLKWDARDYPDNDCKLDIPATETKRIQVFNSLAKQWDVKDFGFSFCVFRLKKWTILEFISLKIEI